jgi:HNH endonuclease
MTTLHIVQGGIENGDKKWLERAARDKLSSRSWIVPKSVSIGDEVVIYVSGYGFFATARIKTRPRPRADWEKRYGAGLNSIKLIDPAISIATVRRHVPKLTWAKYPRSITTPPPNIAMQIRMLISGRRKTGIPDLDDDALATANIDELRTVALLSARPSTTQKERKIIYRARSRAIHLYVLSRANGHCEGCSAAAPFRKAGGRPYLEPHHTTRLADDGPDHPAKVIGLCPNCHRRAHHSQDAKVFNCSLERRLASLESRKA